MPTAKPVLVIGSLNMDLVARCEHLPRTGQTVFGTDFFTAAGGKGANQAVAAARLGARVTMAGCVGDDRFGYDLVAGLRRDGVRSDAVRTVAHPTGTALITIAADGANTRYRKPRPRTRSVRRVRRDGSSCSIRRRRVRSGATCWR